MSEAEIGSLFLSLGILIALAHILGYCFEYLRQPRLVGEILAGILVGPFVLGKLSPSFFDSVFNLSHSGNEKTIVVFGFLYWLGVLLLMFLAGSEVRNLLAKENRRPTAWLLGIGTPLPFLLVMGLGLAGLIPLNNLVGEKNVSFSALLVLASAVAVTSIPVISRIFHDLNIMKTRFASLILGSAVLEDIGLWGVLAIATSYAASVSVDSGTTSSTIEHITLNVIYLILALTILPRILSKLRNARWNFLFRKSSIAYSMVILSFYIALASVMQTNLVFAAFLAGFGLVGGIRGNERKYFKESLATISGFSFAIFIPMYFAIVGYRLVFDGTFSLAMLVTFLLGSSLLALLSVGLASRMAGFRGLDIVNIAITTNARGGPGIVLASVAYESGIISSAFYTTLVLTALITSQIAGAWLRYVLNKGWPLLSEAKS